MKGARAQSLPDVLCDGAAADEEAGGGRSSLGHRRHHQHQQQRPHPHPQKRHHGERLAPSSPHLQRDSSKQSSCHHLLL